MPRFARIEGGEVREVIEADSVEGRFHPDLVWVECGADVSERWLFDGHMFSEPPPIEFPPDPPAPLALIADELDQVAARFEAASTAVKGQDVATQAQALKDAAAGVARAAAIARAAAQQ